MTSIGNHMKFNVPKDLRDRVRAFEFGVKEVAYPDQSRFYFQAPGGQVFRLAPEEGGI
jgi:hypothetical protein